MKQRTRRIIKKLCSMADDAMHGRGDVLSMALLSDKVRSCLKRECKNANGCQGFCYRTAKSGVISDANKTLKSRPNQSRKGLEQFIHNEIQSNMARGR